LRNITIRDFGQHPAQGIAHQYHEQYQQCGTAGLQDFSREVSSEDTGHLSIAGFELNIEAWHAKA
jgi:hypothetical protein